MNIVIIDNNFSIRQGISAYLRSNSASLDIPTKIYSASDGVEGLGYIFAVNPEVVIVDTTLPQYSGKEVLDFIISNPGVNPRRIIVLTQNPVAEELPPGVTVINKANNKLTSELFLAVYSGLSVSANIDIKNLQEGFFARMSRSVIRIGNISDKFLTKISKSIINKIILSPLWLLNEIRLSFYVAMLDILKGRKGSDKIGVAKEDYTELRVKYYPAFAASLASIIIIVFQLGIFLTGGFAIFNTRVESIFATMEVSETVDFEDATYDENQIEYIEGNYRLRRIGVSVVVDSGSEILTETGSEVDDDSQGELGDPLSTDTGGEISLVESTPSSSQGSNSEQDEPILVDLEGEDGLTESGDVLGDFVENLYTVDKPEILFNSPIVFSELEGFLELSSANTKVESAGEPEFGFTLGEMPEVGVTYQISPNRVNWYYYDGDAWEQTPVGWITSNTVQEINKNISSFSLETNEIYVKAFLHSDGEQNIQLDEIEVVRDLNLFNNIQEAEITDTGSLLAEVPAEFVLDDLEPAILSAAWVNGDKIVTGRVDFPVGTIIKEEDMQNAVMHVYYTNDTDIYTNATSVINKIGDAELFKMDDPEKDWYRFVLRTPEEDGGYVTIRTEIVVDGQSYFSKFSPPKENATFTVNDTGDDNDDTPGDGLCETNTVAANGICTLRAALMETEFVGGTGHDIHFNIGGGAATLQTIQPTSQMDQFDVVDLTVDASTEPGASCDPLNLLIELDGSLAGGVTAGMWMDENGGTLRGMIINNHAGNGVRISNAVDDSTIQCNIFGLDADGVTAAPNDEGIWVVNNADNTTIGGTGAGERNYVSGNTNDGIYLNNHANLVIEDNYVGVGTDGTTAVGNGSHGIYLNNHDNSTFENHIIANNGGDGISATSTSVGNVFSQNSIYGNTGLGIDLDDDGITTNDGAGDADAGANNLTNFPVLASAGENGSNIDFYGTYTAETNQYYKLEMFTSTTANPSGNGGGEIYLGESIVQTDGAGLYDFSVTPISIAGDLNGQTQVAMTASICDDNTVGCTTPNNTSEFSAVLVGTENVYNLTGIVYDDVNSDGAIGDGVGINGVTVAVYEDDGASAGVPDATDTLLGTTTTANNAAGGGSDGEYSYSVGDPGNYWIVVDSSTVTPTSAYGGTPLADQTYATAGGYCTDGAGGTAVLGVAGECHGGTRPETADNYAGGIASSEHLIYLSGVAADNGGNNFGFGFDSMSNTNDSGQGSLRQMIENADDITGANSVVFNLATDDPNYTTHWTVSPATIYSTGVDDFTIDATTIAGTDCTNYTLMLEIDGSALPGDIFYFSSSQNIVLKGMVVSNGPANKMQLRNAQNHTVQCNIVGLERDGTTAPTTAGTNGIRVTNGGTTTIQIGGSIAGEGNIVSGNGSTGILIHNGSQIVTVENNLVGVAKDGSTVVANGGSGIGIDRSDQVTLGGATTASANVVSGNGQSGIYASANAALTTDLVIQNNYIGTDATNTANIGNSLHGIHLDGYVVGGQITDNIIKNNDDDGVYLDLNSTQGTALISQNVITNNGTTVDDLGIDIDPDGITSNDADDSDTGSNDSLNYPVITSASESAPNVEFYGTFDGPSADGQQYYKFEFYANSAVDTGGSGEGETYVGEHIFESDASGDYDFSVTPITIAGTFGGATEISAVTILCTDDTATCTTPIETSEFSASVTATTPATITGRLLDGEAGSGINGKSIRVLINGVADNAAATANNAAGGGLDGEFSITTGTAINSGDVVTLYIDDETENGVMVTVSDGATFTGFEIIQDYLIVRHENAGPITTTNLDTADNGEASNAGAVPSATDISDVYTVAAGVLTTGSGIELLVNTGDTYTPGGNVDANGNLDVDGTLDIGTNAVSIAGDLDVTGTYTDLAGATIDMNGTIAQSYDQGGAAINSDVTISNTTANVTVNNNALDIGANDLTINDDVTLDLSGQDLTATGTFVLGNTLANTAATLRIQGGETISISNQDTDSGTWEFYGTNTGSTHTISDFGGGLDYYFLDINDLNGTTDTFQLASGVNIQTFNMLGGTFDANTQSVAVNTNYIQSGGTFNGSTATHEFYANYTQTGGIYNNTTGTTNFYASFDTSGGGTFNNASGVFNFGNIFTRTFNSTQNLGIVTKTGGGTTTMNSDLIGTSLELDNGTLNPNTNNITLSGNLQIDGGTLSASTGTYDIGGDATFNGGTFNSTSSTMTVAGNFDTSGGGTFTNNGGEVEFDGTGAQSYNNTQAMNNVEVNKGGDTLTLNSATDIDGNFTNTLGDTNTNGQTVDIEGSVTITAGTVTAGASAISVATDWTNNSTFTAGTSTVTLDGAANDHAINGTTTFYNLTVVEDDDADDAVLTFQNGTTTSIENTLTLTGVDADDRINIVSDAGGSTATIDFSNAGSSISADFLDVLDNVATSTGGGVGLPINPTNTIDSGNTTGWFPSISGRLFQDQTEAVDLGINITVTAYINGVFLASDDTDASGNYTIPSGTINAGDVITLFIDGEAQYGAAIVRAAGGDVVRNFYENYLVLDSQDGGAITTANIDTANNTADTDIDEIYTLDGSNNLTTPSSNTSGNPVELIVTGTDTFTHTANLILGGNLDVDGTIDVGANAVSIAGDLDVSGTYTDGAGATLDMNGTTAQSYNQGGATINSDITISNTAATVSVVTNALDIGANDLTINDDVTLDVSGLNLTATGTFVLGNTATNTGATLRRQGGETITLSNQDTDSGTWEYYGTNGGATHTVLDFGVTDYYNLNINDVNATGDTFQLGAGVTTANDLIVTSGTLDPNANDITVTGNYTQSGGTVSASTGTYDLNGNYTTTGGTFNSTSGTMTLAGNFDTSGGGTFTNNGGEVEFDGTGAQSYNNTQTMSTVEVNKGGDTLTFNSALNAANLTQTLGDVNPNGNTITLSGNLTQAAGTFAANTVAYDINGNVTLNGGTFNSTSGTMTVAGNFDTSGGGTFTNNGGEVEFDGTGAQSYNNTQAMNNVEVNKGGDTLTLNSAADIDGNFTNTLGTTDTNGQTVDIEGSVTITAGTVTAGASAISVATDWTNNGTFTAGTSTVTLDGAANDHAINGTTTFYNLTVVEDDDADDAVLTFQNGTTTSIENTLTLTGVDADDRINIVSDAGGSTATIDFSNAGSSISADYLDVLDNVATSTGGGVTLAVNPSNSVNSGNTTSWFASLTGIVLDSSSAATIADGKTVRLLKNGVDIGSTTTLLNAAGGGQLGEFTISPSESIAAGDILTFYVDDETENAVTVTVSDGATFSGFTLYQDHLTLRHENGGPITNADLDTADNGEADNGGPVGSTADISDIYTIAGSDITLGAGIELFVEGGDTYTPGGNVDANGNLDVDGTIDIGANALTLAGDLDVAGTFTDAAGASITLDGTTAQSYNQGGATINSDLTISNTGATVSVATNPIDVDDLNIPVNVTLDIEGQNATVGGTFTVDGTLQLQGTETVSVPTLNAGSTVNYDGAVAANVNTWGYANLVCSGTGTFTLTANLTTTEDLSVTNCNLDPATFDMTVGGNFSQSGGSVFASTGTYDLNGNYTTTGGTFNSTSGTMTLAGNFDTSGGGTFAANNGTVQLDGAANDHAINGTNTFYNLTVVEDDDADDAVLTFQNGTTTSIENTLTLTGVDADDRINIVSDAGGSTATIDFSNAGSSIAADFLDVLDNVVTSTGGAVTLPIDPTNSVDSGNTTDWFTVVTSGSGGGGGPAIPATPAPVADPVVVDDDQDKDGIPDSTECPALADDLTATDQCEDTDGDGLPNYNDPDDDNDGISTLNEGIPIDQDEDGVYDYLEPNNVDTDGDGTPNHLDDDDDGDGIPTASENPNGDSTWFNDDGDGDGVPDFLDAPDPEATEVPVNPEINDPEDDNDQDDDGILDNDECAEDIRLNEPENCPDTDNDGVPNYQDPDDDDDGLLTEVEGSETDTDQDGIPDYLESNTTDTDGDGNFNFDDPDDDGDDIPTSDEDTNGNGNWFDDDSDGNGVVDYLDPELGDDSDNDGITDEDECRPEGVENCKDTDGDGIPNHQDNDDDDDGILTINEGFPSDQDGDGVYDYLEPNDVDTDGDGNFNVNDPDDDGDGRLTADENTNRDEDWYNDDKDGDGIPDFLDVEEEQEGSGDSDGDGILDATECPRGVRCPDSDNDGIPDYNDADDDNDGLLTSEEGLLDTDQDGVYDYLEPNNLDTDGDGFFNFNDPDDDGDGIPTFEEDANFDRNWYRDDLDRDGIPDFLDPTQDSLEPGDADNDGEADNQECPNGYPCPDSDNDGIPNYTDTESEENFVIPTDDELSGEGAPVVLGLIAPAVVGLALAWLAYPGLPLFIFPWLVGIGRRRWGYVYNTETGEIISNAKVFLRKPDRETEEQLTSFDGKYGFGKTEVGNNRIRVTHESFEAKAFELDFNESSRTLNFNIGLIPKDRSAFVGVRRIVVSVRGGVRRVLMGLNVTIFIVGLILVIYSLTQDVNTINIILLIIYIIELVLALLFGSLASKKIGIDDIKSIRSTDSFYN